MNAWDKKKNLIADVSMGVVLAFVLYKFYSEPEHAIVCILYSFVKSSRNILSEM